MEDLKALLRSTLAESLKALSEEDRLAAAWPVACGRALAAHGNYPERGAGSGKDGDFGEWRRVDPNEGGGARDKCL